MKITPGLNRRLHQLLGKMNMKQDQQKEFKKDLVKEYTGGRETSSSELRYNEAVAIIKHLESIVKAGSVQKKPGSNGSESSDPVHKIPTSDELKDMSADKMRKKIIGYLREIGFEQWNPQYSKMVADMPRIYKYIKEVGYLGIDLNKYTQPELPKLVSQIESIYTKELLKKSK